MRAIAGSILIITIIAGCGGGNSSPKIESENTAPSSVEVVLPPQSVVPQPLTDPVEVIVPATPPAEVIVPATPPVEVIVPTTPPVEVIVQPSPPTRSFTLIPQHSDVLLDVGQVRGEVTVSAQVVEIASIGATSVQTAQAAAFLPGELVVLLGQDGIYHTEKILSVDSARIILTRPLQYQVESGSKLWNFYYNFSHPQTAGYYAIADYAYDVVGPDAVAGGKHVFLGDSWFSSNSIIDRIKQKASSTAVFINKGVGGNTVQNLITRFDIDVTPLTPTHVWVMAGTNDYIKNYPVSTYTRNVQKLVDKIESIGAKAIVFDASVGPQLYGNYQDFELKALSDRYAEGLRADVW